jgi:hypothetical protein
LPCLFRFLILLVMESEAARKGMVLNRTRSVLVTLRSTDRAGESWHGMVKQAL